MTHRVAFIGTGQMARHHLRALQQRALPLTIVAVCTIGRLRSRRSCGARPCRRRVRRTRGVSVGAALLAEARPDVVHVCTPPGAHFEAAAAALEGGAHVYVEKPFALTVGDATTLLELARVRGGSSARDTSCCAIPRSRRCTARAATLGAPVQVDSHFAFRPAGASAERCGAQDARPAAGRHPAAPAVLRWWRSWSGVAPEAGRIELAWAHATPADLQAVLRAGDLDGAPVGQPARAAGRLVADA